MTDDQGELIDVRILALPVAVHERASQHGGDLVREFQLIAHHQAEAPEPTHPIPERLLALIAALGEQFSPLTAAQDEQIETAMAEGQDSIDLFYRLPAHAGVAAQQLGDMLDEADEFCRSGELLTLATPPEALRYRRWFLGEFVRQTQGEPPIPWPQYQG